MSTLKCPSVQHLTHQDVETVTRLGSAPEILSAAIGSPCLTPTTAQQILYTCLDLTNSHTMVGISNHACQCGGYSIDFQMRSTLKQKHRLLIRPVHDRWLLFTRLIRMLAEFICLVLSKSAFWGQRCFQQTASRSQAHQDPTGSCYVDSSRNNPHSPANLPDCPHTNSST